MSVSPPSTTHRRGFWARRMHDRRKAPKGAAVDAAEREQTLAKIQPVADPSYPTRARLMFDPVGCLLPSPLLQGPAPPGAYQALVATCTQHREARAQGGGAAQWDPGNLVEKYEDTAQ